MGLTVGVKMNYLNDDRLDALSAAFVTGSLQGRARLRFQRLIEDSEKARERVSYWQRLLRPVTEQLQQADEIADGVNAERNWGWLAGFVTAVLLYLGIVVIWPQEPPASLDRLAVFEAEHQPLWVIQASRGELKLQATGAVTLSDMYDFELWYQPVTGGVPESLGLLPEEGIRATGLPQLLADNRDGILMVSREVPGGSSSGVPSTVLYRTSLTAF